jgi:hypothetical protein
LASSPTSWLSHATTARPPGAIAERDRRSELPIARRLALATAGPRGRFGLQRELAPSGAVGDVAVGAGGAVLVVWSQLAPEEEPVDVIAALRPAGASRFGAPEAVSPSERAHDPAAAFDPRTGHFVVAWAATATGSQGEALRVAERSG